MFPAVSTLQPGSTPASITPSIVTALGDPTGMPVGPGRNVPPPPDGTGRASGWGRVAELRGGSGSRVGGGGLAGRAGAGLHGGVPAGGQQQGGARDERARTGHGTGPSPCVVGRTAPAAGSLDRRAARWPAVRRRRDQRVVVPARPAAGRQPGAAGRPRRRDDGISPCSCSTPPCATRRARPAGTYLYRSLRALDAALGGRLLVVRGDPAERRARGRPKVDAPRRCTSPPTSGRTAQAATRPWRRRWPRTCELVRTGSPYAVAPGRVRKDDGDPFKVFTPFHRAWRRARLARARRHRRRHRATWQSRP